MLSINSSILGVGMKVPDNRITNEDLSKIVDTTDEWIFTRTGIKQRRISTENENTSVIGTKAAQDLIEKVGVKPEDIDLIIFATITPDNQTPSCACIVQKNLKAVNAVAFDINAACSGFIYALDIADSFIKCGKYRNALVIGSDVVSKLVNWKDRSTCVLFGDGAGAIFLSKASDENNKPVVIDTYLKTVGEKGDSLLSEGLVLRKSIYDDYEIEENRFFIKMNGSEILRFAVSAVTDAVQNILSKNNISIDEVRYIVPHQANIRIIQSVAQKLNVSMEKFYVNLENYGNTSAASIPIALCELVDSDKLSNGDIIVLVGFGGGLTYGSSLIRWNK